MESNTTERASSIATKLRFARLRAQTGTSQEILFALIASPPNWAGFDAILHQVLATWRQNFSMPKRANAFGVPWP